MLKKIGLGLVILGGASLGVFLRFYRPWHSRWGAIDEEVALEMPGDEIIKMMRKMLLGIKQRAEKGRRDLHRYRNGREQSPPDNATRSRVSEALSYQT